QGKRFLVTGGTGSIGSVIVDRLLEFDPKVIRIFCNDEDATFSLRAKYSNNKKLRFLIGDVRDKKRLVRAMENIDIVYHCAALKHVPLCEYNPFEAVKTNVLGTQNVIDAALEAGVKKVINISTDKAVNPANTMGATKLLAEKLVTDANYYRGYKESVFSSVRFGNVLYSRGSVIRVFEEKMRKGQPITITDPNMTRFMMSTHDAINLIFKATLMSRGREIFILKMPVIQTGDLAEAVIENYTEEHNIDKKTIKKEIIGFRLGEKMYEELMTEHEALKAIETDDMFIVFHNGIDIDTLKDERNGFGNARKCEKKNYSSNDEKRLSKTEIKKLLKKAKKSLEK
ncbi:MAG: SDR family NAD(P)-dependent oxidoreductase, partial [Candidatus Heimdallarchaeota archaeon]